MEDSWLDRLLLERFRWAHTLSFGRLSALPGYAGLVEEAREILRAYSQDDLEKRIFQTYRIFLGTPLLSLARLMVRNAPALAHTLLIWGMPQALRFLVGPSRIVPSNQIHMGRCRFAEQAGSEACIRGCKLPTERFFRETLELELHLEPDHGNLTCTAELAPLWASKRRLQSQD